MHHHTDQMILSVHAKLFSFCIQQWYQRKTFKKYMLKIFITNMEICLNKKKKKTKKGEKVILSLNNMMLTHAPLPVLLFCHFVTTALAHCINTLVDRNLNCLSHNLLLFFWSCPALLTSLHYAFSRKLILCLLLISHYNQKIQ